MTVVTTSTVVTTKTRFDNRHSRHFKGERTRVEGQMFSCALPVIFGVTVPVYIPILKCPNVRWTYISTKIWNLCGDVKVTLCIISGKTSQFFVRNPIQIATKPVPGPLLEGER